MKNGRKRAAGAVILIIMLAVIGMLLVKNVFVVRNVEITGDYALAQEDIVRAAGVQFGKPLFGVNEAEIEKGVNSTGRIKFESMKLRWPGTVVISVSSRKSAAMLMHAGNILVLDMEGCVIEAKNHVPNEDLIYISNLGVENYRLGSCVAGDASRIEAFKAIMEAVDHHAAGRMISEINFERITDIRIIARSGITVIIGDCERIRDKIAWMKAVVADIESKGEGGGVLDVTSASHADYTPAGVVGH